MEISKSIVKQRKKLRLSQKQLAEKMYVSDIEVARWESGKTLPDAKTLPLLAKALDVSVDKLIGDTSKENILNDERIMINRFEIAKYKAFLIVGLALMITGFLMAFQSYDILVVSRTILFSVSSITSIIIGTLLYKGFYKQLLYTKIYKRISVRWTIIALSLYFILLFIVSFKIFDDFTFQSIIIICMVLILGVLMPIYFEKNGYNLNHKNKLTFYITTGILWLFFVVWALQYLTVIQQGINHDASTLTLLTLILTVIFLLDYIFYGLLSKIKD